MSQIAFTIATLNIANFFAHKKLEKSIKWKPTHSERVYGVFLLPGYIFLKDFLIFLLVVTCKKKNLLKNVFIRFFFWQ